MTMLPLRFIPGLLGLAACLTLGACKSTSGSGSVDDVVDYTTPPTKLSKEEYPFEEDGTYREDWAAAGAGVTGVKGKPAESTPYIQDEDTPIKPTVTSTNTPSSSARKPVSSSSSSRNTASRSKPRPKPKPKPKLVAKPTYVKVAKGDTLSSISRRTGVPVSAIKAYNGLKSDLIRDGATIKVPPKKR